MTSSASSDSTVTVQPTVNNNNKRKFNHSMQVTDDGYHKGYQFSNKKRKLDERWRTYKENRRQWRRSSNESGNGDDSNDNNYDSNDNDNGGSNNNDNSNNNNDNYKKYHTRQQQFHNRSSSHKKRKMFRKWSQFSHGYEPIPGTQIIPIKVPLAQRKHYGSNFNLKEFCQRQQEIDGRQIRWIIDLTNVSNDDFYYDQSDLPDGVSRLKLPCIGHDRPPTLEQINRFMDMIDYCLQKAPEQYILVHCTHGLNRTGFLICEYLIQKKQLAVPEAIQLFQSARREVISKPYVITELHVRHGLAPPPAHALSSTTATTGNKNANDMTNENKRVSTQKDQEGNNNDEDDEEDDACAISITTTSAALEGTAVPEGAST